MNALLNFLARPAVITFSLVAFLLVGFSFVPVEAWIGGLPLDMMLDGKAAAARLSEMTAEQKRAHIWMSILNDTAYPLAYGAFFAGLIARFSPSSWLPWTALPALMLVLVDFSENAVHIAALTGHTSLLMAKTILTPLKFGLFGLASIIAVSMLLMLLWRLIFKH